MTSRICFAYENLDRQIGKSCHIYRKFHQAGEFGKMPGMYDEENRYGEKKPSEETSHYLRGGVINTVAVFEAFIVNLLNEACEMVIFERQKCEENCAKCKQLDYEHTVNRKNKRDGLKKLEQTNPEMQSRQQPTAKPLKTGIKFHEWDKDYTKKMLTTDQKEKNKTFTDIMLEQGPIRYQYLLKGELSAVTISQREKGLTQDEKRRQRIEDRQRQREMSTQKFEGESILCAMIRLFYGIRCVMAHGDAGQTLNTGCLKDFPECSECEGSETQKCLEAASDLVYYLIKYLDTLENEDDKKAVDIKVKRNPTKEVFEEFKKKENDEKRKCQWDDAIQIIFQHHHKNHLQEHNH